MKPTSREYLAELERRGDEMMAAWEKLWAEEARLDALDKALDIDHRRYVDWFWKTHT